MRWGRSGRPSLAVAAFLIAAALDSRALAQGSPNGAAELLGGASSCPSPGAVWDQIGTLVPLDGFIARLRLLEGAKPPAEIIDLGGSFRVAVGRRTRDYLDEGRDCSNRARFAAIFVALAVSADGMLVVVPPGQPAPQAAPTNPEAPFRRHRVAIDLGAMAVMGISRGNVTFLPGGALRLSAGRKKVSLTVGVETLLPVDTTFSGVSVRQGMLALDVGVRALLADSARLRPYAELAFATALITERPLDLAISQSGSSYAFGARAAAGVVLATRSRFSPFATLFGQWFPTPPTVFALPYGVLGSTPSFWIGATVGASLGLL